MTSLGQKWRTTVAPMLRDRWAKHGATLLRVVVVLMAIAAFGRLGYALPHLIQGTSRWAAVDLEFRHEEVHRWFAGQPVYGFVKKGDYPPASYALLWPLLGWLNIPAARWFWAITTLAALSWLAYLTMRESRAGTRSERAFITLLAFSVYPTQLTIWNGQLINHYLPILLTGLLLLYHGHGWWWEDLLASVLLVSALVKPTISVPFFWIVCFAPCRVRPIIFVTLGYAALTLLATSFQEANPLTLLQDWLAQTRAHVEAANGRANFHKWLVIAGLKEWTMPVSLLTLGTLGLWTFWCRKADFWLLLGVAALVARFWTHHRLYDDLLILIPMITLFRLAKQGPVPEGTDVAAAVLLAVTWTTMLAPAWLLSSPLPLSILTEAGQTVVWLAVLVFFFAQARRDVRGVLK